MPTVRERVFAKRTLGGWIMLALFVVNSAVSYWSNAEFLAGKFVGAWDTMTTLGRIAITESNIQWALLIGGLLWIGIAAARPSTARTRDEYTPHTAEPAAPQAARMSRQLARAMAEQILTARSGARGREFTTITPDRLAGFFGGNTEVQAQILIRPFLGKWIRVSGLVTGFTPIASPGDPTSYFVDLRAPGGRVTVSLLFSETWETTLAALRHGDMLTGIGTVNEVHADHVMLHDCEIVPNEA